MRPITLLEYQADWPVQFSAAASEIESLFGPDTVRVEHVGSTSVPGLCAKPVLDILLGAAALSAVTQRAAELGRLGYAYRPEYEQDIPDRRYFVRPAGSVLRIHLHAVVRGGALWLQHLAFRDALRSHPGLAGEYAALKRRLARAHRSDKAAYTDAKAPFIARVLATGA